MTQLSQQIIDDLKDKFIGKRISVIDPKSDKPIIGTCEFIGYNPWFPKWELEVVIDRMPITNVDIKTIKLC